MGANRSIGVYQPRSRRGQIGDAFESFRTWLKNLLSETLWRGCGLALLLVAHGRGGHRLPHRGGGVRLGVGAQVDHGVPGATIPRRVGPGFTGC